MAKFENSMVMSVDFIVPRGRGRKKTASNRVIARRPYNTLKGWREFKSFEEAKAHVLNRREEVHEKWEARMAQLRAKTARA